MENEYIKELEEKISSLQNENLKLLRIIGAITYKNAGTIHISQWYISEMHKHNISMYDDFDKSEFVIRVY